jgi:hypothetical protein
VSRMLNLIPRLNGHSHDTVRVLVLAGAR